VGLGSGKVRGTINVVADACDDNVSTIEQSGGFAQWDTSLSRTI